MRYSQKVAPAPDKPSAAAYTVTCDQCTQGYPERGIHTEKGSPSVHPPRYAVDDPRIYPQIYPEISVIACHDSAVQTAVIGYFKSKQLLLFVYTRQNNISTHVLACNSTDHHRMETAT